MTELTRVGICIDSWKLPIFERHLKDGGYEYDNLGQPGGLTGGHQGRPV